MTEFEALDNMAGGLLLSRKPAWVEGYAQPLQLLVPAHDALAIVIPRGADPLTATPVDVFPNPDGTGTPLAQPLTPDVDGRLPGYAAQPVALDIYVYGDGLAPRTISIGFDALVSGVASVNGHAGIVVLGAADVDAVGMDNGSVAPPIDHTTVRDRGLLKYLASSGKLIYADPYFCSPSEFAGADSTGATASDAAFQACRDLVKNTRIADPSAGAGFKKCVLKIKVPAGEWLITQPGTLMDDNGDAADNGTFGYEVFGDGDMARIKFSPAVHGPLFRNLNQYLFPKIKNVTFVGGNTNACWFYSQSDATGVAQGGLVDECKWWGQWDWGLGLDCFARVLPAPVAISIGSPAVISITAHGLAAGQAVKFETTGSLPGGIVADQVYYVIAAGLTADQFEISTAVGGAAVVTSGAQSGVHTAYALSANGNDSWKFKYPQVRDNWQTAFFYSGLTVGVQNQDQAIVHIFEGPNMEITSGDIFRIQYGGHVTVTGGSLILGGLTSDMTGRAIFRMPDVPSHELGTQQLDLIGARTEIRTGDGKVFDSHWKFGSINVIGLTTDGFQISDPNHIMATFDGHGNRGPRVNVVGGTLTGRWEFVYRTNSYSAGPARANFYGVEIDSWPDLQQFVVHTDASGTFQKGGCWVVTFDDACGPATALGAASQGKVPGGVAAGWASQVGGTGKPFAVSFKDVFGQIPQDTSDTGGAPESFTLIVPNGIAKSARFRMPAKPGGSASTTWWYELTNADGSIDVTFGPGAPANNGEVPTGTVWNQGWDRTVHLGSIFVWTDNARKFTLTAHNVHDQWDQALIAIDMDPAT